MHAKSANTGDSGRESAERALRVVVADDEVLLREGCAVCSSGAVSTL
jgi:hypothetical protein